MNETMSPARPLPAVAAGREADRLLGEIAEAMQAGTLAPYLGPAILADREAAPVPITPEALAFALHQRVPSPGRIRTNMWSVAQFIEQRRHRKTLVAFMAEIFSPPVAPTALHRAVAALADLPLIVDVWYDGAMRTALGERPFVEVQGVTRALENGDVWTRAYGPDGAVAPEGAIEAAATLLYKPHGAVTPAKNFLVADSDYVEVLTEIDIQTPIPENVRARRESLGFVFVGCRFHDQMLRTFARQIIKRSKGPHYALVEPADLTRNEAKFLADQSITPLAAAPADLATRLAG